MESEKEFNTAKIKNFSDAFAFLMANRHKQNEIIKEMAEQERKTNLIEDVEVCSPSHELNTVRKEEDPINLGQLITKSKSCHSRRFAFANLDHEPSKSPIIGHRKSIEHGVRPKEEKKSVKFSSPDFNAFQWLMSNRSRSKESNNEEILKYYNCTDESEVDSYPCVLNNLFSTNKVQNNENCVSLSPKRSFNAISPNSLKLTLINDTEEIDIEETFKEEISECGLKKSKSFRKSANNKIKSKKNNAKKKKKSLNIIGTEEEEEATNTVAVSEVNSVNKCSEANVGKLQPSPGIAKFFVSSSQVAKKKRSPDKLKGKNINHVNLNRSLCITHNTTATSQNNKVLKDKWVKGNITKVFDSEKSNCLELKSKFCSQSMAQFTKPKYNSAESNNSETKNKNFTIFSKTMQSSGKKSTLHKSNEKRKIQKKQNVASEIMLLEICDSEVVKKKEKFIVKKCKENKKIKENKTHKKKKVESDVKILKITQCNSKVTEKKNTIKKAKSCKKKDNNLEGPLNVIKTHSLKQKQPNILKDIQKENSDFIDLPVSLIVPNGISTNNLPKKNPTDLREIGSPQNNLFKIFSKKEAFVSKENNKNLNNTNIQVPESDDSITLINEDASTLPGNEERKIHDVSSGLRRSSRAVKKPVVLTYDSFCEENRSPVCRRNKSSSSNSSEKLPKHVKKKKLSKSFALETVVDEEDECWNIFKKSSVDKNLSSGQKKKTKGSNSKNIHSIQDSREDSSDDQIENSVEIIALDDTFEVEDKSLKNSGKGENSMKSLKAFAPIFKIKIQPTIEDLEKLKARDDFLFSESPLTDSLRQTIVESDDEDSFAPFPSYSHIQQRDDDNIWNLHHHQCGYFLESNLNKPTGWIPSKDHFEWKNFVCPAVASSPTVIQEVPSLTSTSMFHIISYLNNESPSLKLFSFFKELLKMKKDSLDLYHKDASKNSSLAELSTFNNNAIEVSPKKDTKRKRKLKSLSRSKRQKLSQGDKNVQDEIPLWHHWNPFSWNQVFSPTCGEFFIGEVDNVKEMEEWFLYWKEKSEKFCSRSSNPFKASSGTNSDDSDSNDSDSSCSNTKLLIGPPGVGKSALVYSLAQQFGFKVLEINASSQRQGKQVMSQLLEATQSHTVSGKSSIGNIDFKSNNNQKLSDTQNLVENSKAKSLILIEDIDIVFEESDEGFISAINTLMGTTKRPIVLTLEHNSPITTAKLKEKYERSFLNPLDSSKIARYLQVMCLVDGIFVNHDEIKMLVEINGNDIRKSIQDLQFWLISGPTCLMTTTIKFNIDKDKAICDPLFPNEKLQPSISIPMAHDCLWVQSNLRRPVYENTMLCCDWKLISPNISFLFNFPHYLRKEKSLMYPLQKDDHYVQIAKQHHQINEMFEFDTPPKKKSFNFISPKEEEKTSWKNGVGLSAELSALVGQCLTQMFRLHSTLSDLDILESGFGKISENCYVSKPHSRYAYSYSGLENPHSAFSQTYSSLIHYTDILEDISENILLSTTGAVQEHINNLVYAKELSVEGEASTLVLHPHTYEKKSNLILHTEIQEKLENYCTLSSMANRQSLHLDYFSYIREIARSDQLSEVLHKLKQQRRFLPQMKQLGLFFSSHELNVICNMFKNS